MTRAADGSVFVVPRTRVQRALDLARARVRGWGRLPDEQRRWLAAAGLTMAALSAAVVVPGAPLPPAAARSGAAAAAVSAAVPTPAAGPFTAGAPPSAGSLPIGKGMWLHHFSRSAGGDPQRLVAEATA